MKRRTVLQTLSALPLLAALRPAFAAGAPISIVVPFAPGGSGDITARLLAQYATEKTGRVVIVENKPGANGFIGVLAVKNAKPDGNTLLLATNTTQAANPSLFHQLPYDPERDFSVVGLLGVGANYLLVRPESPWKTLADVIAAAKAQPGQLTYGYFNTSSQVSGALFSELGRLDLQGVPYKQIGSCVTDLMAGRLQMSFFDIAAGAAHVKAGKLRPIAVTSPTRLPDFPKLPAIAETMPGYEVIGFLAVAVPKAVPVDVKESLNDIVNRAIDEPSIHGRLEDLGLTTRRTTLAECDAFIASERTKWARYVATARIPVE